MRKIAFISGQDSIRKVMLYECSDGVYVFGYACLQDTSSISDYIQDTSEDVVLLANMFATFVSLISSGSGLDVFQTLAQHQSIPVRRNTTLQHHPNRDELRNTSI